MRCRLPVPFLGRGDGASVEDDVDLIDTDPDHTPIIGPPNQGEPRPGEMPRLARHQITLADGHKVGVSVCGRGVPLVLVHGFTAEGMLYAQTLSSRIVSAGFKVVAIDIAGHGGTQGLPDRRRADFERVHAGSSRRVVDELGIKQGGVRRPLDGWTAGHRAGRRRARPGAVGHPARRHRRRDRGTASSPCSGSTRSCSPESAPCSLLDSVTTVPFAPRPGQAVKFGPPRARRWSEPRPQPAAPRRPRRVDPPLAAREVDAREARPRGHPGRGHPRRPRHRRAARRPPAAPPSWRGRSAGGGRGRHATRGC